MMRKRLSSDIVKIDRGTITITITMYRKRTTSLTIIIDGLSLDIQLVDYFFLFKLSC